MQNNVVSKETVLELLGGKWPEVKGYEGFCWSAVYCWVVEDGMLHPSDGFGNLIPGPSFEILKPIENPFMRV